MEATHAEQLPLPTGLWMALMMKLTGTDGATLGQCPPHDCDNVRAVGEIMLCTWLYQAGLFALIGHLLFAAPNQLRPEIVMVAMFLATFILFIDSYMVMRSGWHLGGIQELKRGGLDISGGALVRLKAGFFLAVRIVLSIALAQLTAAFVSLLIFAGDIHARLEDSYLKANAHLVAPATRLVDAGIERATQAVNAQSARVDALSSQVGLLRQNEIDPFATDPRVRQAQQEITRLADERSKAEAAVQAAETFAANESGGIRGSANNSGRPGFGPRYRAAQQQVTSARARAQQIEQSLADARARLDALSNRRSASGEEVKQRAHAQLLTFDEALKAETAKLAILNKELADSVAGRESAIRTAIDNAPDHVGYQTGFLAQIVVLERLAEQDTKIALVILLIDVVSFGFELAAVLAKITSYVPTTYAALLARNAYMAVVRIADELAAALHAGEPDVSQQGFMTANGQLATAGAAVPVADTEASAAPPPRRPRGRPRKYPRSVVVTDANGQEGPIPPPDRQDPT